MTTTPTPTKVKNKLYLVSKDKMIEIKDEKLIIDGEEFSKTDSNGKPVVFEVVNEAEIQTRKYYSGLNFQSENLIILSGAGTSVNIGKEGQKGKTMTELWAIADGDERIDLKKLCEDLKFTEIGDLEKLLSRASRAIDILSDKKIGEKIEEIEKLIKERCQIELPEDSPHGIFLNRITKRKLKYPRAKIFTLNYDTLFEQAAVTGGLTIIDGFSFAPKRVFRGTYFDYDMVNREKNRIKDEENFIPKVFHLYKVHGSINWEKKGNNIVQNEQSNKPLMIFPRDTKYEHSYEQPFFEMMSKFQQNLRKDNVLLICIGFSFSDKHIVAAIKEAISQNPSFRIIIVNRTIRTETEWDWLIKKSKNDSRITLIADEFKDFAPNLPEDKTITKDEVFKNMYSNNE